MNVYPALRIDHDDAMYILTMTAREIANRVQTFGQPQPATPDEDDRTTSLLIGVIGGHPRWWPSPDALATNATGLLSFSGEETLYCLDAASRVASLKWATSKSNPGRISACSRQIVLTVIVPASGESPAAFDQRLRALHAARTA